jgi:hypothetical protein
MRINQQQQQAIFAEIERALERLERPDIRGNDGFAKNLEKIDKIFRDVNHANNLPYDQEADQQNQCVFFPPFLKEGAPKGPAWQDSVEILRTSEYYIVFDRHGRFSVYHQSEDQFGSCIVTNSRDDAIAGLEGISATNLLFDARRMKREIMSLKEERAEYALNIKTLQGRIAAIQRIK